MCCHTLPNAFDFLTGGSGGSTLPRCRCYEQYSYQLIFFNNLMFAVCVNCSTNVKFVDRSSAVAEPVPDLYWTIDFSRNIKSKIKLNGAFSTAAQQDRTGARGAGPVHRLVHIGCGSARDRMQGAGGGTCPYPGSGANRNYRSPSVSVLTPLSHRLYRVKPVYVSTGLDCRVTG